jgi:hypothetical protein
VLLYVIRLRLEQWIRGEPVEAEGDSKLGSVAKAKCNVKVDHHVWQLIQESNPLECQTRSN